MDALFVNSIFWEKGVASTSEFVAFSGYWNL